MSLYRPQKEHVLRARALNQDGRAPSHSSSARNVSIRGLQGFSTLNMTMDDHKRAAGIDLGITKKFLEVSSFVNIESTSNKD